MQTQDEEIKMVTAAMNACAVATGAIKKAKIVGVLFSNMLECKHLLNNDRFARTTAAKIEEICGDDKKEIWPYVLFPGYQLAKKIMTCSLATSETYEICKRVHKSICRISVGTATKAQVSWGDGKTVKKTLVFTENDFVTDKRGLAFYVYRKPEESMRFLRTPDKLVFYLYEYDAEVAVED